MKVVSCLVVLFIILTCVETEKLSNFKTHHMKNLRPSVTMKSSYHSNIDHTHASGLLHGISNVQKAEYYSSHLHLDKLADKCRDQPNMREVILKDIDGDETKVNEYLSVIANKSALFVKSKQVFGNENLIEVLNSICNSRGNFVCLVGSKDTGKSTLLLDLEKRNIDKVYYVNMNDAKNDIYYGIIESMTKHFVSTDDRDNNQEFKKVVEVIKSKIETQDPIKNLICSMLCQFEDVTIVLDDAELAFQFEQDKKVLNTLSFLTKNTNLNVILVSSDPTFPWSLTHTPIKFNLENLTGKLFNFECSPKETYNFLTSELSMKDNLATEIIDQNGGNLYKIHLFLQKIKYFNSVQNHNFISVHAYNNVLECLQQKKLSVLEKSRLCVILTQLAQSGFAPIESFRDVNKDSVKDVHKDVIISFKDPLVKLLNENNVANLIECGDDSMVFGINPEVLKHHFVGLVPSSQKIRIAIAYVIKALDLESSMK